MRIKRLTILATLCIVVLGCVYVLWFSDSYYVRAKLEKLFSSAGVQAHIDGDIRWYVYPTVGVRVEQIHFSVPHTKHVDSSRRLDDSTQQKPLAYVGNLDVDLALPALLRGRLHAKGITIANSRMHIHRDVQGDWNWQAAFPNVFSISPLDILNVRTTQTQLSDKQPSDESTTTQQATQLAAKIPKKPSNTLLEHKQAATTDNGDSFATLAMVRLKNVKFVWQDIRNTQEATIHVESLHVQDIAPHTWTSLFVEGSVHSDDFFAAGDFQLRLQAMFAHDFSTLQLRKVEAKSHFRASMLGQQQQQVSMQVAEVEYNGRKSRIDIHSLSVQTQLHLPALGSAPQNIQVQADIGISLQRQRLHVPQITLMFDLAATQFGNVQQHMVVDGAFGMALQSGEVFVEKLQANGNIHIPQYFVQPLKVRIVAAEGTINAYKNTHVVPSHWSNIVVDFADLLTLTILDVRTEQTRVQASLVLEAFNPLTVLGLVKLQGKKLFDSIDLLHANLPLTNASAQANIDVDWSADTFVLSDIELDVDDSHIRGQVQKKAQAIQSTIAIDSIVIDRYIQFAQLIADAKPKLETTQLSQHNQNKDMQNGQIQSIQPHITQHTQSSPQTPSNLAITDNQNPILNVDFLRHFPFAVTIDVSHLAYQQEQAKNINFSILNDGHNVAFSGKTHAIGGDINITGQWHNFMHSPTLGVEVHFDGIDIPKNPDRMLLAQGRGSVMLQLQSKRLRPHQLVHSFDGSVDIYINDGKVSITPFMHNVCSVFSTHNTNAQNAHMEIQKLQLELRFVDGVATIEKLYADTSALQANGKAQGSIDMTNQTMYVPMLVTLQEGMKDVITCPVPQSLYVDLEVDVLCQGTWKQPLCESDIAKVYTRITHESRKVKNTIVNVIEDLFR